MEDFLDYLKLLWLNLVVKKRNFFEFLKVALRYYSNAKFFKIDTAVLFTSFIDNPFTISKRFLESRGEKEIYAYGETPLTTLEKICSECHITKEDVFFELGSGRGRVAFWLHCFVECKVVGIEYIPDFVGHANRIKEEFAVLNVNFLCQDMLETDFSEASVIYLYGTNFDDLFIRKLVKKFETLKAGTKIVTISFPLTEYTEKPIFEVVKQFSGGFTWGSADIYMQVLTYVST